MSRLVCALLCLLMLLTGLPARAEFPGAEGDVQAWLNLPPQMGSGAEWYVLALTHTGSYDYTAVQGALAAALEATSPAAHSTRLKYALVLAATGSTDPLIARTLEASAGQQGIMSHVFALHLLTAGVTAPGVSAGAALQALLDAQLPDGGWALRGAAADPDVTAMVLQALAPHAADSAAADAISAALDCLCALQRPSGDFASYGMPNPESAAQVIIALTALGIDPAGDPRFMRDGTNLPEVLLRYRLPDGRYAHTLGGPANVNATVQVFLAHTAMELLHAGQPGLYAIAAANTSPAARAHAPLSWRVIAAAVILLASAILCGLILLRRKLRRNLMVVLAAAGLLLGLVSCLQVESADSYYTGALPEKPDAIGTVTLSIRCDLALTHPDAPAALPEDGVLLAPLSIPLAPGDTVYALLTQAAQATGLHLECSGGPGMRYVQGMANLYEFALGDLSGWVYRVNGETHSVGCDQYIPAPGDAIVWHYTLLSGADVP